MTAHCELHTLTHTHTHQKLEPVSKQTEKDSVDVLTPVTPEVVFHMDVFHSAESQDEDNHVFCSGRSFPPMSTKQLISGLIFQCAQRQTVLEFLYRKGKTEHALLLNRVY